MNWPYFTPFFLYGTIEAKPSVGLTGRLRDAAMAQPAKTLLGSTSCKVVPRERMLLINCGARSPRTCSNVFLSLSALSRLARVSGCLGRLAALACGLAC